MGDARTGTDRVDFGAHQERALNEYLQQQTYWADVAAATGRLIEQAIKSRDVQVHSVQFRAKDPKSFREKAGKPSDSDPSKPKYLDPLKEITDLSATRVITFLPKTIEQIDAILKEEFEIVERSDKADDLLEDETFGYRSIHYLVRLNSARSALPEYRRFAGAITEVQVRTILQHAWAEIEHDIQYKSAESIPRDIRRRFMALAGMLELADREFQSIQDQDAELNSAAKRLIDQKRYMEIELTPVSLKLYLNSRLGADGRVSDFSYDWTVRLLKKLGFRTLGQVEECIQGYDDDTLSRLLTFTRQGQISRFEMQLLASMGERFIERHVFANEDWFGGRHRRYLEKLKEAGVDCRAYDPLANAPRR